MAVLMSNVQLSLTNWRSIIEKIPNVVYFKEGVLYNVQNSTRCV